MENLTTIEIYSKRIQQYNKERSTWQIPMANLSRIYQKEKTQIDKAIQECLDNSWFIRGPKVSEFEQKLSDYCGDPAVGVSSCSSGLRLSYEALGLKPGDKIIVPSFTFIATPDMATKLGLVVVWVDCNLDNYTIDLEHLKVILDRNKDIKAIVGVDLFGHTCDWDRIKELAGDIPLVEDAAQSFGGKYKNKITGSHADLTCLSFYPAKNMYCFGDGGAVVGKSKYIDKIKMSKDHGRTDKYVHEFPAWNERLDSIQANILNHMITKIDEHNYQRCLIGKRYDQKLQTDTMVKTADWCYNVYYQYTIRVKNRDEIQSKLKDKGIETGVMWPTPCHQQPAYKSTRYLPNAEKSSREILSLPCWPLMTNAEVDYVIEHVNNLI